MSEDELRAVMAQVRTQAQHCHVRTSKPTLTIYSCFDAQMNQSLQAQVGQALSQVSTAEVESITYYCTQTASLHAANHPTA